MIFYSADIFNGNLLSWDLLSVTKMDYMSNDAKGFNQDPCSWRGKFPHSKAMEIFQNTNCPFQDSLLLEQSGPFCASSCTPCFSDHRKLKMAVNQYGKEDCANAS